MKTTEKEVLRRMLVAAGAKGVSSHELLAAGVGARYGARIHDLRKKDGLTIDAERLGDGNWKYTLRAEPIDLDNVRNAQSAAALSLANSRRRDAEAAGQLFATPPPEPSGHWQDVA